MKAVLVVFTNAVNESVEAEFNEWYTDTHLRDVLKVPGYVAATRYELADVQMSAAKPAEHRYLAMYEVEVDDLADAVKELREQAESGQMYLSETLDRTGATAHFYIPITERVEAAAQDRLPAQRVPPRG